MKRKKSEPTAHRKLSFSVNREDIEIRNDWASAVIDQCRPTDTTQEAVGKSLPGTDSDGRVVGSPGTALEHSSTGERNAAVGHHSTGEQHFTGNLRTTGEQRSTAEQRTTGEHTATVAPGALRALKPLRHLADGLTPGQFTLYTLMYEHGQAEAGEGRLFRAGYNELGRLSGLSKRGIQKIVDALQQKGAVSVWEAPGYCRTQTTVYRVYGPDRIVEAWQTAGYQYVSSKRRQLIRVEAVGVPQ